MNESDSEEEPFMASEDEEYLPEAEHEESDADPELVVEEDSDSDGSDEDVVAAEVGQPLVAKDGTQWYNKPLSKNQTMPCNILRQRPGAPSFSATFTSKEMLKSFISPEICDIILRESNRKGVKITEEYNKKIMDKSKAATRPV